MTVLSITSLQWLYLNNNQLSGSSIPDLSGLTNLSDLNLSNNQLSGFIPALNFPPSLGILHLYGNQLSGPIPDLSALTSLWWLDLSSNQLGGDIPLSFCNLTGLGDLNLDYNKLTASNSVVIEFVDDNDPNWDETQTVPPADVTATSLSDTSIQVNWTPIPYTGDGGYYQVSYAALTPGGPYTAAPTTTADKTATNYVVTNLLTGTLYYFVVQTYTPLHGGQQNHLTSTLSAEASATAGASAENKVYLPVVFKSSG